MKKAFSLSLVFILAALCGCSQEASDTQFLLDTAVTLTADCDENTLSEAFLLCRKLESEMSAAKSDSDIGRINASSGSVTVSEDTARVIEKGLYMGALSGGKFDISIYPLTSLWNIKEEVVPSKDEIAEALKNIDYQSVKVSGTTVDANGKKLDLGGIAKGYIADKTLEFLKNSGAKRGVLNLGGNVIVFGDRYYNVGIKKPFSESELSATLKVKNKSVVTSGVYERFFEKDGRQYHHIIDPDTGYPADTDLLSATIISDSSFTGDALSTVCILLGKSAAAEFAENLGGDVQAVFIDRDYNITYTSGIKKDGRYLVLK